MTGQRRGRAQAAAIAFAIVFVLYMAATAGGVGEFLVNVMWGVVVVPVGMAMYLSVFMMCGRRRR